MNQILRQELGTLQSQQQHLSMPAGWSGLSAGCQNSFAALAMLHQALRELQALTGSTARLLCYTIPTSCCQHGPTAAAAAAAVDAVQC